MKQTIEVPGLPEGWNVLTFRKPKTGEHYFSPALDICQAKHDYLMAHLIVEKIQPRRIVLEETSEVRKVNRYDWAEIDGVVSTWNIPATSACEYKIWREVKATDIPLTNDEPKLSLSVEQCKKFIDGSIRDRSNFFQLVCEFIKDK